MNTEHSNYQAIQSALDLLFRVSSAKEITKIVVQYPELLDEKADMILGNKMNAAREYNDEKSADFFSYYRNLLQSLRQMMAERNTSTMSNIFQIGINQAYAEYQHYLQSNNLHALNKSIAMWERIFNHANFATADIQLQLKVLNNSAAAYQHRYRAIGNLLDLDVALSCWQKLVSTLSHDSPYLPGLFSNLGNCLRDRHAHTGKLKDLEDSISYNEKAVQLALSNSPNMPLLLNNLGEGLRNRYIRTGKLKDLEAAIRAYEKGIQLAPDNSPYISTLLDNLGNGLSNRYARTKELKDLEDSIAYNEKAVQLTLDNSPDLPRLLNNLGEGLKNRYAHTEELKDLEHSISYKKKAIRLTPGNSPYLPVFLNNLGNGLYYYYTRTEELEDLEAAIESLRKAVQLTPDNSPELPRNLINLGIALSYRYAHKQELKDLEAAIGLYEKAAKVGIEVSVDEGLRGARTWMRWAFERAAWQEIEKAYDYAHQASEKLLRIQTKREEKELWLKETQGMAAQAAYGFVKNDKFQEAAVALERGLARLLSQSLEHERLSPLADFAEIQRAAQKTPLVYILTTKKGGLALMVHKDKITPIWLPALTVTKFREILEGLNDELEGYLGACFRSSENEQAWFEGLAKTTQWLWKAVMQPIIGTLPENAQVTLIPVGRLNLLPLHAAWTSDKTTPMGKRYALDCLAISYAPNARSLNHAREIQKTTAGDTLLAIENPKNNIAYAHYATHNIQQHFPQAVIYNNTQASRDEVLNALPAYDIINFYCHGKTRTDEPLQSLLELADGNLTLKTLLEKGKLKARLVALCACETGMLADFKRADEFVSLSTGLLQAGAAGVIASLWSVRDDSTMVLISHFYHLWRTHKLEPAEALRQAQIWLRDSTPEQRFAFFRELMPQKAIEELEMVLRQDFSHPYHWAGFGYAGV